ncbi:MAG: hypothetical protein EOO47_22480 [Flavobacterium sp.]|nr:MAG: hypothetical protein EOO47_22480 [Flavobacterium sp.]
MNSFIKSGSINELKSRVPKTLATVPCLAQDPFVTHCYHSGCRFLNSYPITYFERSSERINRRRDFTYFKLTKSAWLLPVNPYKEETPERNSFELFRQTWGEIRFFGNIPLRRDNYHRDEISFKYISILKHWIDPEKDLNALEITKYEDIDEVAYYNGPI